MRRDLRIATLAVLLIAGGRELRAEPPRGGPPQDCFLERLGPAGGWNPYGGGLLHWWPQHCFPRCGAPDDYCHKPLPCICWPPYPPYYIWAPPEICHPPDKCRQAGKDAH